jgi:uncharacterized protein (UPF0248 family)
MQTIKDLLNKILWDKKENKEDYTFYYLDRIENKEKEIKGRDLARAEGNFIIIEKNGEESEIPMHRIRFVKKGEKLIWKR